MNEERLGKAVYESVQRLHPGIVTRMKFSRSWFSLSVEEKRVWIAVGKEAIATDDALRGEPLEAE